MEPGPGDLGGLCGVFHHPQPARRHHRVVIVGREGGF